MHRVNNMADIQTYKSGGNAKLTIKFTCGYTSSNHSQHKNQVQSVVPNMLTLRYTDLYTTPYHNTAFYTWGHKN